MRVNYWSRRISATMAVATGALLATAAPAAAHTSHEVNSLTDGFGHPLHGPDHLVAIVAVGILAALAPNVRRAVALPVAFVVGMVLGGVLGLASGAVGGVELAIASSVIVLGLLVGTRGASLQRWLPAAMLAVGALHGQAHGSEAPGAADPIGYVVGFAGATVLLHAAGMLVGLGVRRAAIARIGVGAAMAAGGLYLVLGA